MWTNQYAERRVTSLILLQMSLADATVWPSMTFFRFMFPKFGKTNEEVMRPRIAAWCKHMEQHPVGKRQVSFFGGGWWWG